MDLLRGEPSPADMADMAGKLPAKKRVSEKPPQLPNLQPGSDQRWLVSHDAAPNMLVYKDLHIVRIMLCNVL